MEAAEPEQQQQNSNRPPTRTQRRPKQEGRGVHCGTGLDAKPRSGGGGGGGGGRRSDVGGEVVADAVMPLDRRTRTRYTPGICTFSVSEKKIFRTCVP